MMILDIIFNVLERLWNFENAERAKKGQNFFLTIYLLSVELVRVFCPLSTQIRGGKVKTC